MKIKLVTLMLLFSIAIQLSGCKTAIRNVEDTEFVTKPEINLRQIKNAIFKAAKKAGWKPKSHNKNTIIADYSHKRNSFGASVKIDFDRDSYSINYLKSHNLKYVPANLAAGNDSAISNIAEYNPFQKNADSGPGKPATIHKIYNQWVANLEANINAELNLLDASSSSYVAAATPKRGTTRSVSAKTVNCSDQPSSVADGLAKITKASINTRSGASTKCAVTGSVSRNETFTLLGRKDNWYYIALSNNQNSWVYAPLVRKIDDYHQQQVPRQSAPATPQAPTKNISIAVIRFKTLNKEAQEISLGELVSETFTSSLVNSRGFKIIEREQLDKVVKEMEMNQTGFIETTDAVEIGKMLHADAIITGSVALLNNQIQLNARIIEIESAYVISAETKTTSYTLHNITLLANEIVGRLSRKLMASNRN